VHFLCSHSFHQHCFESYAESEAECPTCTPENRKVLDMLRAMRKGLTNLCMSTLEMGRRSTAAQKELFREVAELFSTEEVARLQQAEITDTEVYRQNLQTMIDNLNVDKVTKWCDRLVEVSQILASAVGERKAIEEQFLPLLQADIGTQEVAKMTDELGEMVVSSASLVQQEAVARSEVVALEEELLQVMQELEAYGEAPSDKEETEKCESMVNCPVCRTSERDCILMTCFHPLCRGCAEAKRKCPLCDLAFGDEDVTPLFFQ